MNIKLIKIKLITVCLLVGLIILVNFTFVFNTIRSFNGDIFQDLDTLSPITSTLIFENSITATAQETSSENFEENQVLVQFKSNKDKASYAQDNNLKYNPQNQNPITKLSLGNNQNPEVTTNTIEELKKDNRILIAEPDYKMITTFTPNDEYFGRQWGLYNDGITFNNAISRGDVNIQDAWNITTGNPNTTIAVIDDAIDWRHPDLSPNIKRDGNNAIIGRNVGDNCNYTDSVGNDNTTCSVASFGVSHGTSTAGVAAAKGNNNIGVSGSCPNCSIMPYGIKNSSTNSLLLSNFITALNLAATNGAKIITISVALPFPSSFLETAINNAYNANIVIFSSSGNCGYTPANTPAVYLATNLYNNSCKVVDHQNTTYPICLNGTATPQQLYDAGCIGSNVVFYPSGYDNAISIGGFSPSGLYSGTANSTVDLVAPADFILTTYHQPYSNACTVTNNSNCCPDSSTLPGNATKPYCWESGTSFSTPMVAGIAGLILSQTPGLNPAQVKAKLQSTASNFVYLANPPAMAGLLGSGVPNAAAALNATITNTTNTTLKLRVLLTGAYSTVSNSLRTNLRTLELIPTNQPYNVAPFNYNGTESIVGTIPNSTVDWILIELKNSSEQTVLKKAVLIDQFGDMLSPNTMTNGIELGTNFPTGAYKVIVRHRNHLAIASSNPLTIIQGSNAFFDASINSNVKGGNQSILITAPGSGVQFFGIKMGNPNGDGDILAIDRSLVRAAQEGNGYSVNDINMDSTVDSLDRSLQRNTVEAFENLI